MKKHKVFQISVLLLILLVVLVMIGSRSCSKRKRDRAGGSNLFIIKAPSNLSAIVIAPYQIDLSWQDNSNNEDGFEIERSSFNAVSGYVLLTTLSVNALSYSDTTVSPFITYYYRVRAFNTIGDRSDWSNVATALTMNSSAIVAGESYNVILSNSGVIWVWGDNSYYQLGLGEDSPLTTTIPTPLGSVSDWANIATGFWHTMAVKTNNTLWAWGANDTYSLGLGDTIVRWTPAQVGTTSDWARACGGANHSIAIKTNGTLWSWGFNNYGQIGLGYSGDPLVITNTLNYVITPTRVGTASDWSMIVAGNYHSLALKTNRTLWGWGWNDYGQLGLGSSVGPLAQNYVSPSPVGTSSDWSMITTGYWHAVGLKTDRTLWIWGRSANILYTPTQFGVDTDWTTISTGGSLEASASYTLALKSNGTLWTWGFNNYGQLGLGDYNYRSTPNQIGTSSDWILAIAGGDHAIAQTVGGTLWTWGRDNLGQLGLEDGNTVNQNIPINNGQRQPGNLIATVISYTQISLAWTDNSPYDSKLGFKLERSTDGINYTLISMLNANTTSYTDTGLTPQTDYYYRVKAYYNSFDSLYSNVANLTTICWLEKDPTGTLPSGRTKQSMVWDTVGQRGIMFGGLCLNFSDPFLNDLWYYYPVSGTSDAWKKKINQGALGSPSKRWCHSMVWDGTRVIMFGGNEDLLSTYKNDLWWYDPVSNTWTQKIAQGEPGSPSVRMNHAMVWDGTRVIMFGGRDNSYPFFYKNDLWWYDPTSGTNGAWIQKIAQGAPGSPPSRESHSIVWDGQKVIMFGGSGGWGYSTGGCPYLNDIWYYYPSSNTWTGPITTIASPIVRKDLSMVWDGQKVIMFGGTNIASSPSSFNDVWWYDPVLNAWTPKRLGETDLPRARTGHSMIWDGQRCILFGGEAGTYIMNDIWWIQ